MFCIFCYVSIAKTCQNHPKPFNKVDFEVPYVSYVFCSEMKKSAKARTSPGTRTPEISVSAVGEDLTRGAFWMLYIYFWRIAGMIRLTGPNG